MSKQSILDDIKRLESEIENEQRSFYSLKHRPGIPSLNPSSAGTGNSDQPRNYSGGQNLNTKNANSPKNNAKLSQQNLIQLQQMQQIQKVPPVN